VKWRRPIGIALVASLVCSGATPAAAQALSQRGFAESRVTLFPQEAPPDEELAVLDLMAREEVFVKPAAWLQFAGGLDLRQNTHDQVDNSWHVDFTDRGTMRPAISVRRVSATIARGPFTVDLGKECEIDALQINFDQQADPAAGGGPDARERCRDARSCSQSGCGPA